jgi:cytochrome c oxidase subunit 2
MAPSISRRTAITTAGALILGSVTALVRAKPKVRVINVVAKKFVFVPNEIHVKKGETILLKFTAPEVPMGFNLADFGVRTDIVPGKPATLQLTPDKAGSFTFACDIFCGSGHEDMNGLFIVSE